MLKNKTLKRKSEKKVCYFSVGRRKKAVSKVRIYKPGKGSIFVNGKKLKDYFLKQELVNDVLFPLQITKYEHLVDVKILTSGGGLKGQSKSSSLGISRALEKTNSNLRLILKKKGCLTCDSKIKERKKSGQPGARKKFQFSKR
jgi:small subunit ribosomal protein S9